MALDTNGPNGRTVPRHVAIIMDGNGRWAQQRGLPRIQGHRQGAESVRSVLRAAQKAGVSCLTLYAFSTENWVRPPDEVGGLMSLLISFLTEYEPDLHKERTRLRAIGRLGDLPFAVRTVLNKVMKDTAGYTDFQLTLALSYGGRDELTQAVRAMAAKVKAGTLDPQSIEESTVAAHLYAPDLPDPDLLIRTSGEIRLSNFLLWQLSYAEFYFTPTFWPDFRDEAFALALAEYARRRRRFGDVE